jgi:hypothetical protein
MDARTFDKSKLPMPVRAACCGIQVRPARKGAVAHAGGKAEVVCYADI